MKKMFFYAALVSVAFASCSKDNDVEILDNTVTEEAPVAIEFKMNTNIEVTTRGTGAVGGVTEAENVWRRQNLNVYMFDKGTMDLAINPTDGKPYFKNDTIVAPNGVASGDAETKTAKYYASNGNYDFFAYHADDAVKAVPAIENDAYKVAFEINGTQDLMVAKAGLSKADTTTYQGKGGFDTPEKLAAACERVYSAYSARRGVQPRFAFEHQLSRFVFNAIAMEEGAVGTNGLSIDSVKVKGAKTQGTITVAASDASKLGVTFNNNTPVATLKLTDRASEEFAPVKLQGKFDASGNFVVAGDTARLGESLLLAPGVTTYATEIHYSQKKGNGDVIKNVYAAEIKLKDGSPFVKGTQYDVNIKVYDNKLIVLTAELKPWEDGEDVELDSEQ